MAFYTWDLTTLVIDSEAADEVDVVPDETLEAPPTEPQPSAFGVSTGIGEIFTVGPYDGGVSFSVPETQHNLVKCLIVFVFIFLIVLQLMPQTQTVICS